METHRTPFQGIVNIIRFNWPFFVLAATSWLLLSICASQTTAPLSTIAQVALALSALLTLLSLAASFYIYDRSGLYHLRWLEPLNPGGKRLLNINAGFDETSALLTRFHPASLSVWDFYDPARHTEPSIRRARAAYAPYPGTKEVQSDALPPAGSFDLILLTFAAHEIRNEAERTRFFTALRERLAHDGHIVVTEHLRDRLNLLAYHFGVLHFLPRSNWLRVFRNSGLTVENETRFTPFITTFVLHAAAS